MSKKKIKDLTNNEIFTMCDNYPVCGKCPLNDKESVMNCLGFHLVNKNEIPEHLKHKLYEDIEVEEIKEQEEQKIFKEFEELGYHIHYFYDDKGIITAKRITKYISSKKDNGYQLEIYCSFKDKTYSSNFILDMQLHQLLHKLFEIWGWFDE